jgi:hypothetical protein
VPTITEQRPGQRTEVPAWEDDAPDVGFMYHDGAGIRSSLDQVTYPGPQTRPDHDAPDVGFMYFGSTEVRSSLDQVAYSAPAS